MTHEQFCHWLSGFVTLTESAVISENQWKIIKETLNKTMPQPTHIGTIDSLFLKYPPGVRACGSDVYGPIGQAQISGGTV